MTITVFHMSRQDVLAARRKSHQNYLRGQTRHPSLEHYTVEQIEALYDDAPAREAYVRKLLARQAFCAVSLFELGVYVPVAKVAVATPQEAFELTSNHEVTWARDLNPRVTVTGQNLRQDRDGPTCPSSAMGDLFRIDETGEYFLCTSDLYAKEGFVSLGKLDQAQAA